MADNIFTQLGKLFQSNVIIRKRDDNRLVVRDLDYSQTALQSNFIERYNKMIQKTYQNPYSSAQNQRASYEIRKMDLFRDYELMDQDPIIASALDIYSDESTVDNIEGEVLHIKTENNKVRTILHNLYYDIMNIEFNLWSWMRNLTKYGDFYLQLDIVDKYGVVNVKPISSYDMTRLEDHDPKNPQLIQYEILNRGEKEIKENYEIAHFRLLSDTNFLPYGKSMLEGGRKIFKQLTLMEDAMLIHRIMRAPEKRIFKVDIGNIPPNEVDNYMQRIINKMKKTPFIDEATGDYNLKFNIQNLTEDFFLPVRGGDSGTQIDSMPGMTYDSTEDLEYLKNRLLAALHVPKAFLGYEENLGSKATLAAEDVRFARTIERIQRIIVSELTKIAVVHLYSQGYQDAELVNFELNLTNPSTIYEQEKVELWSNKISLSRDMMENGMMSSEWIYKNIFNFSDEKIKEMDEGIVFDKKQKFRREQIETEGNDPAKSGESKGTPGDMAMGRSGTELDDGINIGGSEEGGQPGAGRPKEGPKYGKDGSARDRDPLGKGGLALAHFDALKKSFGKKDILKETKEIEDVETEYEDFIKEK